MPLSSELLIQIRKDPSYANYLKLQSQIKKTASPSDLTKVKVAVLRNYTVEPLLPIIEVDLFLSGLVPQFYIADFDNILSEVTDENSPLFQSQPEIIILSQWLESLAPVLVKRFLSLTQTEISEEINRICNMIDFQVSSIRKYSKAIILINNFSINPMTTLGVLESQGEFYLQEAVQQINSFIKSIHKKYASTYIIDIQNVNLTHGFNQIYDFKNWQTSRLPLTSKGLVQVGKEYTKTIRALRGKTKKCLILDCDNTLWGGIIGEDGLGGIKLSPDYPGSSYLDFQKEILNLHDRGIILALCSKNNEADVLEVLDKHPHMQIKKSNLATWQVNWQDKAANIKEIAATLNIGLDSLVFIDDSAFECQFVKEQLPEVEVIHLSGKPSNYINELLQEGFFDSFTYTNEDRDKNKLYQVEHHRKVLQSSADSIEDYLKKLKLVATIGIPSEFDIPRVSQLTQKTNQYNLTTRRYTEDEIRSFISSKDSDVYFLKLTDMFSDMGLVAMAILRHSETESEIDTFLMSCRVIGRGVEEALLNHLIHEASKIGKTSLKGIYIPTKKNEQVANFYKKHEFDLMDSSSGTTIWKKNISQLPLKNVDWMQIIIT